MTNSPDLASALSDYLSGRTGQRVDIGGLQRISSGWESDVYRFDAAGWYGAQGDAGAGGYILRLYFGAEAGQKARDEYRALALLARSGYPVPRVDLFEPSTVPLGRAFLIMQRVDGVSLGHRWRDPDPAVQRREIQRFCDLFAQLHTLEWQALPGAQNVPTVDSAGTFAVWEGLLAPLRLAGFEPGIAWLRGALPRVTPQPQGLVHWDFHHENILIDEADRAWVIDWTQLQSTDVRFDLAWTLVVLASERDPVIAQQVREGYLAARGWSEAQTQADLRFFEAAACFKRVASVVVSLKQGADALGMRPGAEEIMLSRLANIATVYQRWLAITGTHLAEADVIFAAHL